MSKFVAKFRKNVDYNDDYEYSPKRKRSGKHDPTKKLSRYDYDIMMNDDDTILDKKLRKRARHY